MRDSEAEGKKRVEQVQGQLLEGHLPQEFRAAFRFLPWQSTSLVLPRVRALGVDGLVILGSNQSVE